MRKEEVHMIFHRYDIIEAELKIRDNSGSIQKKKRPYVIVSNETGTKKLYNHYCHAFNTYYQENLHAGA